MSTLSQFVGGGIRSTQRGLIVIPGTDLTATATISAVDVSKSQLRLLGTASNGVADIALTNSTTITATRNGSSVANRLSWELTEWR